MIEINQKEIKTAGIIGANGYTGSELVRLLVFHPHVSLSFLYSRSNPGQKFQICTRI